MGESVDRMATLIELLARDVLRELGGVPHELLNRPVEAPEANSLFAIATHLMASGRMWTLAVAGGRDIPRDRDSEFVATGTFEQLTAGYEQWIGDLHEVLDGMPDEELGRATGTKPYRPDLGVDDMTVEHALLHCLDHMGIHLGHIQVTKQFLAGGLVGGADAG